MLKKNSLFIVKKRSEETKLRMSINSKTALTVKIKDIGLKDSKVLISYVQAGKFLGVSERTIRKYKKSGRVYKNKYFILSCD